MAHNQSNTSVVLICLVCQQPFGVTASKVILRKCCSRQCAGVRTAQRLKGNNYAEGFAYVRTPEIIKKQSDAAKGKKKNYKVINGMKGRKHTLEARAKISSIQKQLGAGKWNKGKKRTIEYRKQKSIAMRGERSPTWKGGITPLHLRQRQNIDALLWRESIFQRDNWTCAKYGTRGGDLHAHHIRNFAEAPDLRLDINNGITLSAKAHREFHKLYGMRNNTLEQLLEFLT